MEYVLTEEGKRKVAVFIKGCEAKRKEILDAGLDTAEDTQIPTEADILSDLNNGVEVDEDGDYYNAWGVTDNYCSDRACELAIGEVSYRTQPACRSRSGKPLRLRNILMQLRKTLK